MKNTFSPDAWAHAAGIELGTATVFLRDVVALELAEPVVGNQHKLTPRGVEVLGAIRALLPLLEGPQGAGRGRDGKRSAVRHPAPAEIPPQGGEAA